ncbi:HAMP domain-containing sensor histidine kinase [Chryseolinea sp. T2]|uniref:sensor histidine kinase n=1 Tax=Chryseolinea sp. T2 TaxID=3129255 RepID=UPI003076F44C
MSLETVPSVTKEFVLELARKHPNAMVVNPHKHEVLFVSEQVGRITGIQSGMHLAELKNLRNALVSHDQTLLLEHWTALQSGKAYVEFETAWRNETRSSRLCISAVQLFNGEYIVVYVDDISTAKAHEDYLVEFGTKKNTTLDSVLHFVSGAITLTQHFYIEAGRNLEIFDKDNLRDLLDLINQNSQHCLDIINSVTRNEYDKSPLVAIKASRISLIEKLQYILENIIAAYPQRQFTFYTKDPEIIVEVDEFKLLQVINNFVFNAIKFSSPDDPIDLRVFTENKSVVISVADKGIGIPIELQSYIFDRHTIAGRTGLNGEPSHGIGLSICKQLANQMGGRIWFTSSEKYGSVFYLAIPEFS